MTRSITIACLAIIALCTLFAGEGQAHVGWGIVVDRHGQLYFADVVCGTIWKVDTQGKLTPFVIGKHSHGLILDKDGNLYGEHVYYDDATKRWLVTLWKATPEGTLTDILRLTPEKPIEDLILFDRSGNRYFWNGNVNVQRESQILKMTPDGKTSILAGSDWGHDDGRGEKAKFSKIGALAWGTEDSLYVTEGGYGAVRKITMDGMVLTLGGYPLVGVTHGEANEAKASSLMGLTVDEHGDVYVADNDHACIRKIMPGGTVTTVAQSSWFWKPSGIAVDAGNIFVLEHSIATSDVLGLLSVLGIGPYVKVSRISADRTVTTLATVWGKNTGRFVGAVAGTIVLIIIAHRILKQRLKKNHQAG
jgi:hypothetical protein